MNKLVTFLLLFASGATYAQSINDGLEEHLVNFEMNLIDYEVHEDKLVAIVRDRKKYFIYYTDSTGAGLFQEFDIFFPTDIETNDWGELYLVGLDSAYQLEIANFVETERVMDVDSYKAKNKKSSVHFSETDVYYDNRTVSFYQKGKPEEINDVLLRYHKLAERKVVRAKAKGSASLPRTSATTEPRRNDVRNQFPEFDPNMPMSTDYVRDPIQRVGATFTTPGHSHVRKSLSVQETVNAYKVANCLWLITESNFVLTIYSADGVLLQANPIHPYSLKGETYYDGSSEKIYFTSKNSTNGNTEVFELKQDGSTELALEFRKGFAKSDLKFSNGFVYCRDSKGKGVSIKRIPLN